MSNYVLVTAPGDGLVPLGEGSSACTEMANSRFCIDTVKTLYSTIYYSKYFIELNIDKSTQYVALWTHKRHPIPRPFGRAMECLLWVFHWNWPCYKGFLLYTAWQLRVRFLCNNEQGSHFSTRMFSVVSIPPPTMHLFPNQGLHWSKNQHVFCGFF